MTMPTSFANAFAAQLPSNNGQRILPIDFVPSQHDVICKKGHGAFNHVGNRRFRVILQMHLNRYEHAPNKTSKSLIVNMIVDMIREYSSSNGGGFVRFDTKTKRWYEIGDAMAREKVGFTLREELRKKDPVYMEEKRRKRRNNKRHRTVIRNLHTKQTIASAIKETDNLIRKSNADLENIICSTIAKASNRNTTSECLSDYSSSSSEDDEEQQLAYASRHPVEDTASAEVFLAQPKLMSGESRTWFDEDQIKQMNSAMDIDGEKFEHDTFFGDAEHCPRQCSPTIPSII